MYLPAAVITSKVLPTLLHLLTLTIYNRQAVVLVLPLIQLLKIVNIVIVMIKAPFSHSIILNE
jgi:hypothetical protein